MKFVEKHILPRMTQEEIENLNSSILTFKIKFMIWNIPKKKTSSLNSFSGEFYQTCKDNKNNNNGSQNVEGKETFPNTFSKASVTLIPKPGKKFTRNGNFRQISFMKKDAKKILIKISK